MKGKATAHGRVFCVQATIWWNADRTHITREKFDTELNKLTQGDEWIIDGDYSRTYEARISCCDTIVFLDYDEYVCMQGITERVGKKRTDIPWTEDALDPELVKLVKKYRAENRPLVYELIRKYPEKRAFVFKTRAEADRWLSTL